MSFESDLDEIFDHWEDLDIDEIKEQIMQIYADDRIKECQKCKKVRLPASE